jgi:hypothetical protein
VRELESSPLPKPFTTKLPSCHTIVIQPVLVPLDTGMLDSLSPPSDTDSDEGSEDGTYSEDDGVVTQAVAVTTTGAPGERYAGRYRRGYSGSERAQAGQWIRAMAPKDVAWTTPNSPSSASVPVKRVVRRCSPSGGGKEGVRTRRQRRAASRPDVITAKPLAPFRSAGAWSSDSSDPQPTQ